MLRHVFGAVALFALLSGCSSDTPSNDVSMIRIDKGQSLTLTTSHQEKLSFLIKDRSIVLEGSSQPLLVVFFTTWCSSCLAELPQLATLHNQAGQDIKIVGVLLEPNKQTSEVQAFVTQHAIPYSVTVGPANMDLTRVVGGIRSIPQMFLFDAKGELAIHYPGPATAQMIISDIQKLKGK